MKEKYMSQPKVSVIIPVYNGEQYLEASIQSVSDQSFAKHIEVIVVDDGSIDSSLQVASDCLRKYKVNGTVIHQSNQGVSIARNIGIDHAKGQFITFLDSDDTLSPDCIEVLYRKAISHESDLVYGGFREVNATHKVVLNYQYKYLEGTGMAMALHFLWKNVWIRVGSFIVSRQLLKEKQIKFHAGCKYGEDQEFIIQCLVHAAAVFAVPQSVYNYRQHASSTMRKASLEQFDFVESMRRVYQYLITEHSGQTELIKAMREHVLPDSYMFTIDVLVKSGIGYKPLIRYIKSKQYDELFKSSEIKGNSQLFAVLSKWERNAYLYYGTARLNYKISTLKYYTKKILVGNHFMEAK